MFHNRDCQDGVWAWDADPKEMFLVIPAVLAMLGDNPMQSEIVCYIGLKGKFFCRNCWVKGSDAANREVSPAHGDGGDMSNVSVGSNASNHSQQSLGGKKTWQKQKETLKELADCAHQFLGVCQSFPLSFELKIR